MAKTTETTEVPIVAVVAEESTTPIETMGESEVKPTITEEEAPAMKEEPSVEVVAATDESPTKIKPALTDAVLTEASVEDSPESFDGALNENSILAEEEEPATTATVTNDSTNSIPSTPVASTRPLKVLFLSSDTGGGHRASAESLAKQFQLLYPGSSYELYDVVEENFGPPYNNLVGLYKHLSAHPSQWKLLYTISNSRGMEMIMDAHFKMMFERAIRRNLQKHNPDVVVSVHPMMTNVPVVSCKKISQETGRHMPMFTVVTDLGSAHCLWFANGVEKMFVGSEQVKALAKERGKVPDEKIIMSGLPIRHDFAVQAEKMGERMSEQGAAYQVEARANLKLPFTHRKTVLLMGGGEGVGSLSNIVDALYVELAAQGIDALLLVVCGRNEKLKENLETRDWDAVFQRWSSAKADYGVSKSIMSFGDSCGTSMPSTSGCIDSSGTVTGSIRRMLSNSSLSMGNMISAPPPTEDLPEEKKAEETNNAATEATAEGDKETPKTIKKEEPPKPTKDTPQSTAATNTRSLGNVHVMGLGFVTRMAEYMVASDVLVTKAGPGTISEAAALSLPVMLTSFLPGQEEGNVDFVLNGGFGAFVSDSDPIGIAEEVCMWLTDEPRRTKLCAAAKANGNPYAARDIVRQIGDSTCKWIEINEEKAAIVEKEQRHLQATGQSPQKK